MQGQQYQQESQQHNRVEYQYYFTEAQMRHYFYKTPNTYKWLLALGTILIVFGIGLGIKLENVSESIHWYVIFLGTGFLLWGCVFWSTYNDRPTDEQYDRWVAERSEALYETALKRLNIVDDSECESIIEVQGGISSLLQRTNKFLENEIVVKRLSNGGRQYSINVSMYIFFLKNAVAIYSGYINALAQKERFEDADRYYYKDIVAVSTSGPVYTIQHTAKVAIGYRYILGGPVYTVQQTSEEIQMQGFLIRAANGDVVGTDYATKIVLRKGGDTEAEGIDDIVAMLLYLLRSHNISPIEVNQASKDIT